jgi:perosamine synthetase
VAEGRAALQDHLKAASIGTRVMYPPINKQEVYSVEGDHPASDWIGEKGL